MLKHVLFLSLFLLAGSISGQGRIISGKIISGNQALPYANIYIENLNRGTFSDQQGHFEIRALPDGEIELTVSMLGFKDQVQSLLLNKEQPNTYLEIELIESNNYLNEVVVTGTKTFKRKSNSPVIVHVFDAKALESVQACNLSESLNFQPGLRVETDCQTCNYTQLRMNGLGGGYSQILINGRPIFSPLTGLYGMDQLPANMIDRIEVVRGGASSLYGSSAIGGTVNVLTKIPNENSYELNFFRQSINGRSTDDHFTGNTSLVAANKKSGVSFFLNSRNRAFYDHNEDRFSEISALKNLSLGTNLFIQPDKNQKLELSLSKLNEYRFGGEMVEKPAYLTQQSEERTHDIWMGSADYQLNFNQMNSSLISYAAWQNTKRDHYTGILPDEGEELQKHIENPPYGTSETTTYQVGLQLNHHLSDFLGGTNVFTLGTEYVIDDVFDEIQSYHYLIDQTTKNLGMFIQSDWELIPSLNLLAGLRMDRHNFVDQTVFSPRASLLYKPLMGMQIRASYGTGFRAPQAFDTDLHIAFAGGGISRIQLSPELEPESSRSYSASINYDKATELFVAGFTLEGFYTQLEKAFYQETIGEDEFGEVFEKRNGDGALVKGITLELRANYDQQVQLESGFTFQTSHYDTGVSYFEGMNALRDFLRTPEQYAYSTLSLFPGQALNANISYVYTGPMSILHFAGAPNQDRDELLSTPAFSDLSIKAAYTFTMSNLSSRIEVYGGIKNIFNQYQSDFDSGKYRDSNYIYGPSLPRTFYFGLKWKG